MSWADLDTVALAKPTSGRAAKVVLRDDRTLDAVAEHKHLSIIVAIARVVRGRLAVAEKLGGQGSVVYLTSYAPPSFLVEAVVAAGGTVFDGTREHTARTPMATTMQLDAAFSDLASIVRRRHQARSFGDALDGLERDLRRKLPERGTTPWWTAIIELAALTGECLRERRAARWIEVPSARFPLALDLGKSTQLFPGKLAQTILEGGVASMRSLLDATEPTVAPITPIRPGATAMPLLCDRRAVPIEKLTWERLISEEVETPDVPVIAYIEDHGGVIKWPFGPTTPTAALRQRAHANLAKEPVVIECIDGPGGHKLAVVTGSFYAAESMLVPATMAKVAADLGDASVMLVGVPARGQLVAIDAAHAIVDDDFQNAFLMMIEKHYLEAPERDRISSEVIVYQGKPLGRVQSNLMDMRRLLRSQGIDPDSDG